MKIDFRKLIRGVSQSNSNPLAPYSSIEEIWVAKTVYDLQNRGRPSTLEGVAHAVPGMSPEDVAKHLLFLEEKQLLSLTTDGSLRRRYTISENNGIILHRIIKHNNIVIQDPDGQGHSSLS